VYDSKMIAYLLLLLLLSLLSKSEFGEERLILILPASFDICICHQRTHMYHRRSISPGFRPWLCVLKTCLYVNLLSRRHSKGEHRNTSMIGKCSLHLVF